MEVRSSRRMRTLVTDWPVRRLSGNQIARALISMMAEDNMLQSEAGDINGRPLTTISTKTLCTHGRTIHWVIRDRVHPAAGQSARPPIATEMMSR